jgi:hypothetical protein
VQKIMPKLRGIETSARSKQNTECLDKIGAILENRGFNLTNDFRFACEAGHGQFMWNSAYYIDKDETTPKSTASAETTESISENEQHGGNLEDK